MILNDYGHIVSDEWEKTAVIRPYVKLDAWVVMPDHFHGIIVITNDGDRAPGGDKTVCGDTADGDGNIICGGGKAHCDGDITYGRDTARRVPTIIRSFKSAVTKRVNKIRNTPGAPVWQKNYDERIIKNALYLNRIREYIIQNPANRQDYQKGL